MSSYRVDPPRSNSCEYCEEPNYGHCIYEEGCENPPHEGGSDVLYCIEHCKTHQITDIGRGRSWLTFH